MVSAPSGIHSRRAAPGPKGQKVPPACVASWCADHHRITWTRQRHHHGRSRSSACWPAAAANHVIAATLSGRVPANADDCMFADQPAGADLGVVPMRGRRSRCLLGRWIACQRASGRRAPGSMSNWARPSAALPPASTYARRSAAPSARRPRPGPFHRDRLPWCDYPLGAHERYGVPKSLGPHLVLTDAIGDTCG